MSTALQNLAELTLPESPGLPRVLKVELSPGQWMYATLTTTKHEFVGTVSARLADCYLDLSGVGAGAGPALCLGCAYLRLIPSEVTQLRTVIPQLAVREALEAHS